MYKFKTPLHKFILRKLWSSHVRQESVPHFTRASIQSFWFVKAHQKEVIFRANLLHYCFVWKSFLRRTPIGWEHNALVVLANLDMYNGFGIWSLGLFWALHCSHRDYSWVVSKPFPGVLSHWACKLSNTTDLGLDLQVSYCSTYLNLMESGLSSSWWFVELSFLPILTSPGIRRNYFESL